MTIFFSFSWKKHYGQGVVEASRPRSRANALEEINVMTD